MQNHKLSYKIYETAPSNKYVMKSNIYKTTLGYTASINDSTSPEHVNIIK